MIPATPTLTSAVLLIALLCGVAPGGVFADQGNAPSPGEAHERWLEDVALLISDAERQVFLGLREPYQREDFISSFWRVRDPFPETPRNELRERWEKDVAAVREELGGVDSDRARMLLAFGQPARRKPLACGDPLDRLEVWSYPAGGERIRGSFTLVFVGHPKQRTAGLWQPADGLRALFLTGRATGLADAELVELIRESCIRSEELLADLATSLDFDRTGDLSVLLPAPPSDEWVRSYQARSTELPSGAEPLAVELKVTYPGRHQSRTVVQGLARVPIEQLTATDLGGRQSYNLLIDGEVLRQGELFERFRYRFDFPRDQLPQGGGEGDLPLVLQRYLRPGPYTLVIKVEDLASRRASRREVEIDVPWIERRSTSLAAGGQPSVDGTTDDVDADAGADGGEEPRVAPQLLADPLADLLTEANSTIVSGDHSIQVLPLPERLSVGRLRVEARAVGDDIDRVSFLLDGKPVMRKRTPPYSVELDLGIAPRVHELTVVAQDAEGRALASDEVLINAGPHRFAVRLLEPQPGRPYRQSMRVHAEVEVPEGEQLDRVELFLDETRFATLYQAPFEQPLLLPPGGETRYVRALAVLEDGATAEDVVFINAPDYVDHLEVDFVELYASVTDRRGHYVEGLTREDFRVREDGEIQEVRRFEAVEDLPIRAGIVLDTSISMFDRLPDVERAAYGFLEKVISPRDRAALFTFSDEPHLAVRFTNDPQILAGGLASLVAEGETALYDSLVFALHYFSGLRGKRALVVLTDGADSASQYTYDDAIEYARRTGVPIYVIGLGSGAAAQEARLKMDRIARETGGDYYAVDKPSDLDSVYERIEQELRAQYLLGYQSAATGEGFRSVEIEVVRPGLHAKTMRGYYP